ncbi:hypothetical protein AWC29_12860 [Mycobacterium triplex]|uniref:Uncharacterized protein n=1 Tax=Mycobacterium triplex TaxID=47839 RepID=A0ABX3W5Z1_9MYCO|nr:hypothetical protein AWC29_12860 [Mycobacterium triplex]
MIANYLHSAGLQYHYERPLDGLSRPGRLRPDFSFIDDSGDVVILEHLGMLDRTNYKESWKWKRDWYRDNGYIEGENLFTTQEQQGLDMDSIAKVVERIRLALE